jgi:hypothetical protein
MPPLAASSRGRLDRKGCKSLRTAECDGSRDMRAESYRLIDGLRRHALLSIPESGRGFGSVFRHQVFDLINFF